MSVLKVCVVHDVKAGAYLEPRFYRAVPEAIRTFEHTVNSGENFISKYPADYTLLHTADYDEATGRFMQLDVVVPLGNGLDFVKKSEAPGAIRSV